MKLRIAVLLLLLPSVLTAQHLTPGEFAPMGQGQRAPSFLKGPLHVIDKWAIIVRRSFITRLEEQKPATLSYSSGDDGNVADIHAAMGHYFRMDRLNVTPLLEFERRTAEGTHMRRTTGGLILEYQAPPRGSFQPLLRAMSTASRMNGRTSKHHVITLSGYADEKLGGAALHRHGVLAGTYYPYAGFELLQDQHFSGKAVNARMAVASFEGKWFPGNTQPDKVDAPADIGVNFVVRRAANNGVSRGTYRVLVVETNLYFDTARRVAIGATYRTGSDPATEFVRVRSTSLGLRLKL